MNSSFGVLLWLKNAQRIPPMMITKADWRAWVVLTKNEHFGLIDTDLALPQ
jgi:hypothetical protein